MESTATATEGRPDDRRAPKRPAAPVRPKPDLAHVHALNTEAWDLRMQDAKRSSDLGDEALALAERLGDPAELICALRTVALVDLNASRHRQALDRLNRTLSLLAGHPDPALERDCKNLLACTYQMLHNSEKATALFLECLNLARHLNNENGEANALLNLGNVARFGLNDAGAAVDYFHRALEIQRRTGNVRGQGNTLHNLAETLLDLKRWDEARAAAEAGVQTAQQTGIQVVEALCLSIVACTSTETGEYEVAAPLHDQALRLLLSLDLDNPEYQAAVELKRAENLTRMNRFTEAETALNITLRFLDGTDLPAAQVSLHRALAGLHKRVGRYAEAFVHSETAFALKEAHDKRQSTERAQAMMMIYEVDRAQAETEQYRLRTEALALVNAQLEAAAHERARLLGTLRAQQTLLERQVREDGLSGLYNRRHAEVLLTQAFEQHDQFSVAMIDIDHFKRVNDTFSHQTGDDVIRQVAALLKANVRSDDGDMVGRYGGEEFVMLLAGTPLRDAWTVLERLRLQVQAYDWEAVAPGLRVTLSAGAALNHGHASWEKIVGAADEKLYEAKRTRNTVAC